MGGSGAYHSSTHKSKFGETPCTDHPSIPGQNRIYFRQNYNLVFVKHVLFIPHCAGLHYHQYSPVAVSVDAPQLDIGLASDRGCPGGAVDQCQLSKAAALADAGRPLTVHIHLSKKR